MVRNIRQAARDLLADHLLSLSCRTLGPGFTYAYDGGETSSERQFELAVHKLAGLAHLPPTFGVPQDHVTAARVEQHQRRHLAGKGALLLEVHVLSPHRDMAAFEHFRHGV